MALISTGAFAAFLEKATGELKTKLNDLDSSAVWKKYMRERKATKLTERATQWENMGALGLMAEGGKHPAMRPYEGYSQSWTQHIWGGKAIITELMREFTQYEIVSYLMRQLKESAYKSREIIGAAYCAYGELALASVPVVGNLAIINSIGGDGLPLFHAAHTWKSGSKTWSNYSSATLDLTETSIQTVAQTIGRWTDNSGAPMSVDITGIMFPVELEGKYLKAMKSSLEPATANNAINTAKYFASDAPVKNKWLSDATEWFPLTNSQDGELEWRSGRDIKVRGPVVIDQDSLNEGVFVDFICAHGALALRSMYKVG